MMKGLLEFITGPDAEAQELRNRFIFKIVPMVNPDGVIVGNYRCSLAARDLNRNYRHPRRENFPTVWYLKNMVDDLARKYEISLYCDLHGHSRKPNVFMYGNNTSTDGDQSALGLARAFISERLFPWLMAARSPDKFCFKSCKFNIRRCKESTGRVVMWRQMRIFNSFTLEATFSGTVIDEDNCRHFNILDLMETGKTLAQTVLDYDNVQDDQSEQTQVVLGLTRVITEQILVSKGLIERNCKLPDFTLDKEIMEADAAKVQESAEKWTGALLQLLNSSPTPPEDSGTKNLDEGKAGAEMNRREEEEVRPVYSREDVVLMLGKLTGRDPRSMEDCLGLLAQMEVQDNLQDSDSSDSDSESEPEMKPPEPKVRRKKRKSKKHRDHDRKMASHHDKKKEKEDEGRVKAMSALPTVGASHRTGGSNSANSVYSLPANVGKQATSDKGRSGAQSSKQVGGYISKYEGRHNGGVPCFTEERSMERAAKRLAELRKKSLDERTNRELTFYCVDDGGLHPFSQEELRLKLEALAEASGASPTHLMGLNVRTGYTHADNLQELTPSPSHHISNVNNFVLSTLHNRHQLHPHHQLPYADLHDHSHSSSDVSDSDDNLDDSSLDAGVTTATVTATHKKHTNSGPFSPAILSSGVTAGHSDPSLVVPAADKIPATVAAASNTALTSTSPTSASHNGFVGYPFPVTARRNPYHSLDPLNQPSLSSHHTTTPRHQHNPHHLQQATKQNHHRPTHHRNNNHHSNHIHGNHKHNRPRNLPQQHPNHLPPASTVYSYAPPFEPVVQPYKGATTVNLNTGTDSHNNNAISNGLMSSSLKKSLTDNIDSYINNNNKNISNNINNNSTNARNTTSRKSMPKRESTNSQSFYNVKDINNLKRANTTLHGKTPFAHGANHNNMISYDNNSSNSNKNGTQVFSTQGLFNRAETFVYDMLTAREIPSGPKPSQKPPQNVGQLVQQLSENLSGVVSPLPASRRLGNLNRNSPFRGTSRITPHSVSPSASPMVASSAFPTNRSLLPDQVPNPQRLEDKHRLGGKPSAVIRSLQSPRQEFSWE